VADTLSRERRSALMKRVTQKHTAPELLARKHLHRLGLRYNIADRRLPGSPDLSFPRHRAVLFVHGCFWHGHHCRLGRRPTSNTNYWLPKINGNRCRDAKKEDALRELGWRVFTLWQCEIEADAGGAVFDKLADAIRE
jgi:DNA mismatch endonuclease, patch repair protein